MNAHDPQKVVEDLRNHLATHDRPLAFLFGAGTSYSINIAHIRILPDDYDLKEVKVERVGFRYYIKIKGAPDASLGEVAEKT